MQDCKGNEGSELWGPVRRGTTFAHQISALLSSMCWIARQGRWSRGALTTLAVFPPSSTLRSEVTHHNTLFPFPRPDDFLSRGRL